MRRLSISLVLVCSFAICGAVKAQNLDESWAALAKYKLGESRKPLREIEKAVAASLANADQRAAMAKKLAGLLAGGASTEAKDFCCHQLALCATPAQIPDLAKLLGDEKLSHPARFVLENMSDPAAGAALRDAMGQVKGRALVGVITSLGIRRDGQALATLAGLVGSSDAELAGAAATALGRIGTPDAAKALLAQVNNSNEAVKGAVLDASLECAENLCKAGKKAEAAEIFGTLCAPACPARVRLAGLNGLAAAAPEKGLPAIIEAVKGNDTAVGGAAWGLLRNVKSSDATKVLCDALAGLPAPAQARMLDVLADRGDVAAREAVVATVKSSDPAVKEAAIRALARLGNAQDVPALAAMLTKGNECAGAAKLALSHIRDAGADKAICDLIGTSTDADVRISLIEILGDRLAVSAVPMLFKLAKDDASDKIRVTAVGALGDIAGEKDGADLLSLITGAKDDADRDAAVKAVGTAAGRMKDRDPLVGIVAGAIAKADGATKAALFSALSRIGGEKALEALRGGLKETDAGAKDAAVRALAQWTDVAAVPDLLAIVRGEDAKHRVLALRGLASLVQKLPATSAAEAVKICQQMLEASSRAEDKRVALSALGTIKSGAALNVAVKLLADDQLKDEAAAAVVRISQLLGGNKEPAKSALQKVIDSGASDAVKKRAKDMQTKGK